MFNGNIVVCQITIEGSSPSGCTNRGIKLFITIPVINNSKGITSISVDVAEIYCVTTYSTDNGKVSVEVELSDGERYYTSLSAQDLVTQRNRGIYLG